VDNGLVGWFGWPSVSDPSLCGLLLFRFF
jgi:hypothetical protein